MSESSNSGPLTTTPTFVPSRFSSPTWSVKVNNVTVADAILEKVDLGFGTDLSTATFTLPRNPVVGINPLEGDTVEVIVNSATIFKGSIKVKSDHIGNDGLKITYTAVSKISDYNNNPVFNGSFNDEGSDFPLYRFTALGLFNMIGVSASGVPNKYPGSVNVTDQTQLSAAEAILAKVGNYKLHYDMVTESLDVYALGSGGTNTRSFIVGGNVIAYNINKSTENIVDKVVVVGAPTQTTSQRAVGNTTLRTTADGRQLLSFTLSGKNIRDIKIEGMTREKPEIEYDAHTQVNKAMLRPFSYRSTQEDFFAPTQAQIADNINRGVPLLDLLPFPFKDGAKTKNDAAELHKIVLSTSHPATAWTTVPISLEYNGTDLVTVFISEIPKKWYPIFISGDVLNSDIGLPTTDINATTYVTILDDYNYDVGSMRVTLTVDGSKPTASQGSGKITRSITDGQYQIVTNNLTGENNSTFILQSMAIRASAEYERTHMPQISGTVTVLGDESITLKHTILIDGELLDVLHITHNFTAGFTTDVSVTNERLRVNTVLLTPQTRQRVADTERDRRRGLIINNVKADVFRKRNQQKESEGKKNQEAEKTGPYAVYHP